ncbi:PadR family transcriptional regulator [Saccharopolyspora indica]|uniref:PadR family transcriptional regulator n=1 Tax=Saccharopolyspora indica TaxID=1229659 RepID=UPI0022EBA2AD|nr:PadR family transcriptional regulator [Saccharopolyspora indica]MDA3645016.1 PadR family transcriptional regulator [Saccharopolyspora indica]
MIRLLVLGAVRRRERAHGYLVRTDLESWGAHEWSTATSGSIYHALNSLTARGLLRARDSTTSDAGGPPRTEYEITDAGEAEFFDLLRRALSRHDPRLDTLSAAVGFLEDLPRAEAISLLRQREAAMQRWRESIASSIPADEDVRAWGAVGAVVELWLHTADSRSDWTRHLLRRVEAGEFRMADER